MSKNTALMIESCEYFLSKHDVFVGYSNEFTQIVGKRQQIFVDNVKVPKNLFGNMIFSFIEEKFPLGERTPGLTTDLMKQCLMMAQEG